MFRKTLNLTWASDGSVNARYFTLVVLLNMMLGGLFPQVIQIVSHSFVYIVWVLFWFLIGTFSLQMDFPRLVKPMTPFLLWMGGYIIWGIMAASYPIFEEGYRLAFRFGAVACAMAIVTSNPSRLKLFCNATQFVLLVNLLVTLLLINSPHYQQLLYLDKLDVSAESDRFAGFWGNANVAGLVSLQILALSHWASRPVAWMGRLCGVLIVYLTASRTATWTLVAMFLYYLVFVADFKARLRAVALVAIGAFAAVAFLTSNKINTTGSEGGRAPIARVLDLNESNTKEAGEMSRLDLLLAWFKVIPREPWYGFGLYTLYGGEAPETMKRPDLPSQGPHNLYVAVFLDVGIVGLLTFLAVVGRQLYQVLRAPFEASVHLALMAFCTGFFVFSMFNHNLFTDFYGWMGWCFFFQATGCPALRGALVPRPAGRQA